MWRHVSCPYILKPHGIFYHNNVPAVVTPWMPHGTVAEYSEKHTDVDRLQLVRLNVPGAWRPSLRISSPCRF